MSTHDLSNVTKQQLADAGLNPFAVELLVESFAPIGKAVPSEPFRFIYRGVEVVLRIYNPEVSAPKGTLADTARLDWLESRRANVYTTCADEWDTGSVPALMRYAAIVENWRLTGKNDFTGPYGEDPSDLRAAIDKAMLADSNQ